MQQAKEPITTKNTVYTYLTSPTIQARTHLRMNTSTLQASSVRGVTYVDVKLYRRPGTPTYFLDTIL